LIRSEPTSKTRGWVPLFVDKSSQPFRAQLASASATPDIANHYPHDGNYDHEYESVEGNAYTYRVFHRKSAVYGVEAIKAADGRGQRERVILRHLKNVFVRMILGFPGK
jgi:hypothetical protein